MLTLPESFHSSRRRSIKWMRLALVLIGLAMSEIVLFMRCCKPAPTRSQATLFTAILIWIFIETVWARWYTGRQ